MTATASLVAEVSTKGAKKAETELKGVSKQAKRTEQNVKGMGSALQSVGRNAGAAAAAITGPMGGVSSRISSVVTVLTSGTAAATGFGLAIAGLGFVIADGVAELDRMNIELAKTEAILSATGFASGKTALQLQEQARSIALATLASTQGIQQAQARLLTFDKIHGQVFDDAISLTQDLAAVFGGDAASQATQLGKALQNPVKGLTALNRVGVSFTKQQADQVKAMVASGKTMEAQTVIIQALKNQVGGAGAAIAKDSLAGKLDTAGQLYDEFTGKLADNTGAYSLTGRLIDGLVISLGDLNELLAAPTAGELFDDLLEINMQINSLENTLVNFSGDEGLKKALETKIKLLKDNADILREQTKSAAKQENDESLKAEKAAVASLIKQQKDKAEAVAVIAKEASEKETAEILTANTTREQQLQVATDAKLERERVAAAESAAIQLKSLEAKAAADDAFIAEKQAKDKAAAALEKEQQKAQLGALGDLTANLGATLGEQNDLFKAAAITQATINTYNSATGAFSALAPIPIVGPALGAAAAGVAIAAGLANVSKIASARYQGGSLAAGQASTIAEKGELEVIAPANASRVRTANQMKSIMGESGGQSNTINITVIDQGSNNEVSAEQNDDGKIILLIRDTVSGDFGNNNSQISKSFANSKFNRS
jgi:hypothetical protein